MRLQNAFLLVALIGFTAFTGCANARFVKTDQGEGVVAMPANTNCWPTYYRDHAEALIRQKCPAGYEVVYEEEAVVGQTAHTHTETETNPSPTLNLGGHNSEHGSGGFAGVAVPLGTTEEKSRQTTTYEDNTEWRIYYKAKAPGPPAPAGQVPPPGSFAPRS
jgi:hypothetical protein